MNEQQSPETSTQPELASSRRRFLGKGAVAAPVVVTLASQPALGVTCFTPSRSLSRNTSVTQKDKYGECTGAESPGNYKAQSTPGFGAYHWPASVPPDTPFHSVFSGSRWMYQKRVNGNNVWVSRSMLEVLNNVGSKDVSQVCFHIVGAYLNKMGGNGAVIPDVALTVTRLQQIYTEWDTKTYFQPMAGVPPWYAEEIKSYLKVNGIVI